MKPKKGSQHGDFKDRNDEELMVMYQSGSEMAFRALYDRHSAKVFGYLANHLKDRNAVDDVFQSTFLKLHRSRDHYDPAFPFLPWLFTVCKSVMLDYFKQKSRIQEESNEKALDVATSENLKPQSLDLPDLGGLPVMQKTAIELRYVEDLSFEEIAGRLETSPGNVRQLVSRAVRNLKSILSPGGKPK